MALVWNILPWIKFFHSVIFDKWCVYRYFILFCCFKSFLLRIKNRTLIGSLPSSSVKILFLRNVCSYLVEDMKKVLSIKWHSLERLEQCNELLPQEVSFTVLSLNIISIQHNFDAFLITISRLHIWPDVIILYECWLNENRINPKMSGYITLSTKKVINKSGGVTAYVRGVWKYLSSRTIIW